MSVFSQELRGEKRFLRRGLECKARDMERREIEGINKMDLDFLLWWFLGEGEELYMNSFGSSICEYKLADDEIEAR